LIAVDTNILIYAISPEDEQNRTAKALRLLDHLGPLRPLLPLQVVGEYLNVTRRRGDIEFADALSRIEAVMAVHRCEPSRAEDFITATGVSIRFDLQYFDALILTVAARAGATMLLSEDMHDGLVVEGVRIVNPFNPSNDTVISDYLDSAL
jgi:predicted nucleic acid-binding protein